MDKVEIQEIRNTEKEQSLSNRTKWTVKHRICAGWIVMIDVSPHWSVSSTDRIDNGRRKELQHSRYFSWLHSDTCSLANHMHLFLRHGCCSSQLNASRSGNADASYKVDLFVTTLKAYGGGGKMQDHPFFDLSFFAVFAPDRGWSLSSSRSLDSCHRNWLHSPSSLRPVDSRVAAGQPIMKWPWSCVSRAIVLLKQ